MEKKNDTMAREKKKEINLGSTEIETLKESPKKSARCRQEETKLREKSK